MSAESDVETVEVTGDEERDNEGEGDGWVTVWRDSSDDSENGIHINNRKMFLIWMFKQKGGKMQTYFITYQSDACYV